MDYIIVQAGGKGTRLKYLTENKPKALVPIDNFPMLFYLFRKYPDKRFVIIADYKKEVMREYLYAFAEVKYQIVDASGSGTCGGIRQAVNLIPENQPFMLIWSDLILPEHFELPGEYMQESGKPQEDYVGISQTFSCRWKFEKNEFIEESSSEHGVAGFFLFTEKSKLADVPLSGELVRWMQQKRMSYKEIGLSGAKEFGLLEEYQRLDRVKCRPFNKTTIEGSTFIKEPVDQQGEMLAKRECAWYEQAKDKGIEVLPEIYDMHPLKMEYINGKNIYEYHFDYRQKKDILEKVVASLQRLHETEKIPSDTFSIKEAYFFKTFRRLSKVQELIPFAREKEITVNGRKCRNVYYHKRELEEALEQLAGTCENFCFIHGDCTFSNMMLRENGNPVLIDPRGYFGHSEIYGDARYDWAKMYYSIVGNYDKFNLKDFKLHIGEDAGQGAVLEIDSNHWKDMEDDFFKLTGADRKEIQLLHAVIWLSLTTYAWQDYDSVCGAFYNGLYYLEEVL